MKISYFFIAVQFIVWGGFFDSLFNEEKNAWGGRGSWDFIRDFSFLINQTFWRFGVLICKVLEAVTSETCYKVVFLGFFLDSIYKNLILISQGNSGFPQSTIIIREKEWAGLVLATELYSIHRRLIFFPFAIELNTFFMHVSRK